MMAVDSPTEIINGHEVEVCAGGQLGVKEGWIYFEEEKCCICQRNRICLGFDTSSGEYWTIYICIECVEYITKKPNTFESEILRKKYTEYESKIKYDEHGNRITAKEDDVQKK